MKVEEVEGVEAVEDWKDKILQPLHPPLNLFNLFNSFNPFNLFNHMTPKSQGYYFPAEFAPHASTWLSWPHKEASWPGKIETIFPSYVAFIKSLARLEAVNINVVDAAMQQKATDLLVAAGVNMTRVHFHIHPTNDAWCRDHGPAFLLNKQDPSKRAVVDWGYNAWGN